LLFTDFLTCTTDSLTSLLTFGVIETWIGDTAFLFPPFLTGACFKTVVSSITDVALTGLAFFPLVTF
jgi:hypothetical protein